MHVNCQQIVWYRVIYVTISLLELHVLDYSVTVCENGCEQEHPAAISWNCPWWQILISNTILTLILTRGLILDNAHPKRTDVSQGQVVEKCVILIGLCVVGWTIYRVFQQGV